MRDGDESLIPGASRLPAVDPLDGIATVISALEGFDYGIAFDEVAGFSRASRKVSDDPAKVYREPFFEVVTTCGRIFNLTPDDFAAFLVQLAEHRRKVPLAVEIAGAASVTF